MPVDGNSSWKQFEKDGWRTPLDRSGEPAREPGPINLNRFMMQPAFSGVPTFGKLPLCLNPEDLRAGNVDVAICGAPVDASPGHKGAAWGPMAIRGAERYLPGPPHTRPHQVTRVDPFEVLTVVDYGDAAVHPMSVEESHDTIRGFVREIAEVGVVPIVLGGDHSILWPNGAAMADVYGAGNVGVLHLDAHADCSTEILGHRHGNGTPIRRLIEDEHIPGRNFIQVGLRGYYPDDELKSWMEANGLRSHFMAEIDEDGMAAVIDRAVAEALDGPEHLYISLDVDVLDPAYAPGTGTPEPGGLTTRELFPILRRLCSEVGIVGAEVVEVCPQADPGYTTALNAHRAIMEMLTGLAMHRLGA